MLAYCVEEGGPILWDIMTKSAAEQREIQTRMRENYPWADLTFRMWRLAIGALILNVVLCAIEWPYSPPYSRCNL